MGTEKASLVLLFILFVGLMSALEAAPAHGAVIFGAAVVVLAAMAGVKAYWFWKR